MTLEQITYLIESIDSGSITAAAKKLHLSQPNLSIALKEMETEIGCHLFLRSKRGITPTDTGKLAYDIGKRILQDIDKLQALGRTESGAASLRIGSINSFNLAILPQSVLRFRDKLPHTQISVTIEGSELVLRDLLERQIDLGIIAGKNPYPRSREGLTIKPICHTSAVLCMGADLAKHFHEPLDAASLRDVPMLLYMHDGFSMQKSIIKDFFGSERSVESAFSSTDLNIIKRMVVANQGYAILNSLSLLGDDSLSNGDIVPFGIKSSADMSIFAVWHEYPSDLPLIRSFYDVLERTAAELFAQQPALPNSLL